MLEPAGSAPAMKIVRATAVVAIGLLATVQIVRSAFVAAYADDDPGKAAAVWSSHPDVLFKTAMNDISGAAASGRAVPREKIAAIYGAADDAPLAAEPFLVRGVEAQIAGNQRLAGQAFEAARRRNPRSLAAQYFLADHYLRTNQTDAGLAQLAVLTRLIPKGIDQVASYYASYAKAPGGAPRVKAMLRRHPEFEDAILLALAKDAANADLVLALSRQSSPQSAEPPAWHGLLVESLIKQGQYAKARQVWAKLSGWHGSVGQGLFDPQFSGKKAPPPFNWTLLSTASGLAEGQGGGKLHVIYYGRDNARLASQTLTLAPGQYRIAFEFEGDGGGKDLSSLSWRVSCLPSNRAVLNLGLAGQGSARLGQFIIPADCPAQLLELVGASPEFPQTIDTTIKGLALERIGS
jgi:hypothetical protein